MNGIGGSAAIYLAPFARRHKNISKVLLVPRIQIGASATNQAYVGLNWHTSLADAFFAAHGISETVHNGDLDIGDGPLLGCRL